MLRLILGASGGGKTTKIVEEVGKRAEEGLKSVIVVPEQYSHEAERLLCSVCGDGICLHAEILSFSRLCTRVLSERGGAAVKTLDPGGRILIMSRAVSEVSGSLKALKTAGKAETLQSLISTADELRRAAVTPEALNNAARDDAPLSLKMRDMAVIMEAYVTFIPEDMWDINDRLDEAAEKIGESSIGNDQAVYFDGFSDFTAQELKIISELLKKNTSVTVSLNCESLNDDRTENALPRKTAERLLRMASDNRQQCDVEYSARSERKKAPELVFLDENLLYPEKVTFDGESGTVALYSAGNEFEECAMAAAEAIRFVRAGNRWRDIAVTARDWQAYSGTAESVFEKYGVPVQVSKKSDILQKPVLELPLAALDTINTG
ncbi:MAG: ATP-dependent nuclease subunit B, partial [Oscillospiraceae bacterium]|nr:ATP-dependent nuclease subunit B [Oscillospiraceae bacterium]